MHLADPFHSRTFTQEMKATVPARRLRVAAVVTVWLPHWAAIKRRELLVHAATWMNRKIIMPSGRNQTHSHTHSLTYYVCLDVTKAEWSSE